MKLKLQYLPPDAKSWLTEKDSDAGKDWKQEEKGATEDEMVGWHHWLIDLSLSKLQETVKNREGWRAAVHGVAESETWLINWTKTMAVRDTNISNVFWKLNEQFSK